MTNEAMVRSDPALPSNVLADRVVARLREAESALQQATTIHQAKLIADVASAQQVFATRQKLGEDIIGYAHAIKIHALARLGDLLKEMPKATGGEHGGRRKLDGSRTEPSNPTPTYADLGLDKKTAMVAQQLAALDPVTRDEIALREKTITQARHALRPEPAPPPAVAGFDTDGAVLEAVHAVRSVASRWPPSVSLAPLIDKLRLEADRLGQQQQERRAPPPPPAQSRQGPTCAFVPCEAAASCALSATGCHRGHWTAGSATR